MKTITEITISQQKAKVIRLAAYCRVSSDSEDQLHSFAAQIRYYTEYTQRNAGFQLVDIYADEGLTGTSMEKRNEFHRLLRDCKKGMIDRIIVKSISRFARNTEELLAVTRMLSELGISVYFEEQGIDTSMMNSEMIITFPGMAAQQESVALSGNMRWSYKKRIESGAFNCCAPAYGFNLVNGQLEINESEAVTIRRIFDLYLQGYGKQTIANMLNEEGIPRRYSQTKWYAFTVDYVLNNERYMGDALLQKCYTTESLPFKKVKNKGEQPKYYVENSNPAIVSRDIYQAAQALQKERQMSTGRKKTVYPLTGIIQCPTCGRSYRKQIIRGKAYWMCSGMSSGATKCRSARVQEDAVYSCFQLMIMKLKDNRSGLIDSLIKQIEEMQYRANGSHERIKELDKEIADLGTQNLLLARLHTKRILSASDYAKQSAELGNKITDLRIERRKKLSEDEDEALVDELKTLDSILEKAEIEWEFNEELFEQIVLGITVKSNAELTFKILGGIELTEIIVEKGRCRTA
ncbi:MAG: recombinase family protein [Clostridiales bacterium]|nr:recombinase family protein [Clostridiales bacterium]